MLYKRLIYLEEYDRFIAFNQCHDGAHVDRTYLIGAAVYAFYRPNEPDRWVATYAINTKAPFRCLMPLTLVQQVAILIKGRVSTKNLVEITLLCRDKNLGWLPGEQQCFYTSSIIDALKTRKKHLLGATANSDLLPKLCVVLNRILYAGQVDMFGTTKYGWIIYTSWFSAIWNIVRYKVGIWMSLITAKRRSGILSTSPRR